MGAELYLAIDACVTESGALLLVIIKKIALVVKFKEKCKKLLQDAQYLRHLLDTRRDAIQSLQVVAQFTQCFNDIDRFVERCTKLDYVRIAWEVIYTRDYPALRKRITALRGVFLMESVAELLVRETKLIKAVEQVDQKATDGVATQLEILTHLRTQNAATEASRSNPMSTRALRWDTIDPTLRITSAIDLHFEENQRNLAASTLAGVGKVVCYKIEPTTFTHSALLLYRDAQDGAFVQRLFGVAQAEGSTFAVMECLDGGKTLAEAIAARSLPQSPAERLQIAYDVCKSMAWYHRAQMKLKSHSDDTIILKRSASGKLHATLTRLEGARHFLEQTSGISYDLRYEAFEYETLRQHSAYTDVYSLGTVIWQIIGSRFPYGIPHAVGESKQDEEYEMLKEKLARKELPGSLEDIQQEVASIVQRCWSLDPLLRPTSSQVAVDIENLLIKEALTNRGATSESTSVQPDLGAEPGESSTSNAAAEPKQEAVVTKSQRSPSDGIFEAAMKLIRKARKTNLDKAVIEPVYETIPVESFETLLDGDEWTPMQHFLVGALIFWKLTSYDTSKLQRLEFLTHVPNDEATRTQIALFYLESAAEMDYTEAYLEMYKAHALLARILKGLSTDSIDKIKQDCEVVAAG